MIEVNCSHFEALTFFGTRLSSVEDAALSYNSCA